MKKYILKVLSGVLIVAGFVIVLGTAGASDCGVIDLADIISQCAIGLFLMFAGIGVGIVKEV